MKKSNEQKLDTLEQIKRLLVLALVQQGVQSKDIASALGVDPATISRMVPTRQIKKK
jgi:Mn-dependent DtxR family transcriptional regulator